MLDLDVTAPQAKVDAKMKEAIAIYGGTEMLVNSAGYTELSFIEDITLVISSPKVQSLRTTRLRYFTAMKDG